MSYTPNKNITMVRNICTSLTAALASSFFAGLVLVAYNATYVQNELYLMTKTSQIFMIVL